MYIYKQQSKEAVKRSSSEMSPYTPLESLACAHRPANHHHQLFDAKFLRDQSVLSLNIILNPNLHTIQSAQGLLFTILNPTLHNIQSI